MTRARITVLSENSVVKPGRLIGEHGFAALLERGRRKVLFDTGHGAALLHNARELGIDLKTIDCVVLSHGHSDHTGGLKDLLGLTGPLTVYAHPSVFSWRCWKGPGGERHPIGMPFGRSELEALGARLVLVTEPTAPAEGFLTTGSVPRVTAFETGDPSLEVDVGGMAVPDAVEDDLSLVVEGADGLAVILGCAHAGVVNILHRIADLLPERPVRLVMGGTHLGFCGKEQMDGTVRALTSMGVSRVGAGHCTGLAGAARLREGLGEERFFFAGVGSVVEV